VLLLLCELLYGGCGSRRAVSVAGCQGGADNAADSIEEKALLSTNYDDELALVDISRRTRQHANNGVKGNLKGGSSQRTAAGDGKDCKPGVNREGSECGGESSETHTASPVDVWCDVRTVGW